VKRLHTQHGEIETIHVLSMSTVVNLKKASEEASNVRGGAAKTKVEATDRWSDFFCIASVRQPTSETEPRSPLYLLYSS
jgi:hypothetical protein